MSTIYYRADDWDKLVQHTAITDPADMFKMHCPEGHVVLVRHDSWHWADIAPCECGDFVDLAHARRHVDCPCDE